MAGDSFYQSVSLLLNGDGADGSATITDSGPGARTPSSIGTALISTDQSKWGGASIEFTGAGNQIQYANNAAFNFGSGAFTVEFFVRPTAVAVAQVLLTNYGTSTTGWAIALTASGGIGVNLSGNVYDITGAGVFSAGAWSHVAISGAAGDIKAFVGGTQAGSTFTGAFSLDTSTPLTIGGLLTAAVWYDRLTGFIDDLRITKGVARYTADFTPPAAPFIAGMGQVSGVIRDATNTLCARTVRAYRRDSGALVGSMTSNVGTGAYAFTLPTNDELSIVALDDAGGTTENDRIIRVVPT